MPNFTLHFALGGIWLAASFGWLIYESRKNGRCNDEETEKMTIPYALANVAAFGPIVIGIFAGADSFGYAVLFPPFAMVAFFDLILG